MKSIVFAAAAALSVASVATATQTLQMDLNGLEFQVKDASGANSAFGGLTHTGSVDLAFSTTWSQLVAILIRDGDSNPFVDMGFNGTLVNFTGNIDLNAGMVTGGNLDVDIGSDHYTTTLVDGSGNVDLYAGGGFTIDSRTFDGAFTDAMFGNVDVTDWFMAQGVGHALQGSLLQFNFDPNASGAGFADMDLFVVVPLPPAGLAGMATLAGLAGIGYIRRRR